MRLVISAFLLICFASCQKEIKKKTFKLQNLEKIELLSYPDRIMWDTLRKGEDLIYGKIVSNNKLDIDSTFVRERIELNKIQQKELINLLVQDTCLVQEMQAACYMPRHLILFRDKKNRILGYQEFCFTCVGSRESKNLEIYNDFCMSEMRDFFEKAGIKYFVETTDQEKAEYLFLKNYKNR